MSGNLKRYWFMASELTVQNTHYICCAESYEQADKILGVIPKRKDTIQLTWGQLSELTGCLIPCQSKPKNFANGFLMFGRKGNLVSVW